jgi:hypothetical protein
MRISRQISALAFAVMLLGCGDKRPTPPRLSEVMPGLPLPPLAAVVERAGGEDALQITFRSTVHPDSMAGFYRNVLTSGEWSLVGDNRTADGVITLYAERNGPPLWVTIRKDSTSSGSMVILAGAVTKKDSTRSTHDTARRL